MMKVQVQLIVALISVLLLIEQCKKDVFFTICYKLPFVTIDYFPQKNEH